MENFVEYLCVFKLSELDGVKRLVMVGKFDASDHNMVKFAFKMFKEDEYYFAYV